MDRVLLYALFTALGLVGCLGPLFYLIWKDKFALAVVWFVLVVSLGMGWVLAVALQDSPNEHMWREGAGPETVCVFEEKKVLVGKVVVSQLFTVCRP